MLYVFDLDGVLVSSREANQQAYLQLGVDPPADFHIRPWQEWTDKETHDKKNELFIQLAPKFAVQLPMLILLQQLSWEWHDSCVILSNCSAIAFETLDKMFNLNSLVEQCFFEVDLEAKIEWILAHGDDGIYFDDSLPACKAVRERTRWQVCHIVQQS